jgi:hypothetical protein
LEKITDYLFIK